MKPFFILCLSLFPLFCFAQQSDGCEFFIPIIQDTKLASSNPNGSSGHAPQFIAKAGTNGGTPTFFRSLIEFNLSEFDSTVTVDSAFLDLYYHPSPSNLTHDISSGTNASYLSRITEQWSDSTASWNNEPSYTSVNQVLLPQTTNNTQDVLHIDVTALLQDMVANPSSSFGLHFALQYEDGYRRQTFASMDTDEEDKHPRLSVYVCEEGAGISEGSNHYKVYIANESLIIESEVQLREITIYSILGSVVHRTRSSNKRFELPISELQSGPNIITSKNDNSEYHYQKVMVIK